MMKNNSLICSVAIITTILLCSCTKAEEQFCRSFVNGYMICDGLTVEYVSEYSIHIKATASKMVSLYSTGTDKELYDNICQENNDMTFNDIILFYPPEIPYYICYYPNFTSIDVISDRDFNAEHPAGTSLNDIIRVYYNSVYDYVSSEYTQDEEIKTKKAMLSNLTAEDLQMVTDYGFDLTFGIDPLKKEKHNLTITFTDIQGKKYHTNVVYDFTL